MQIQSPLRRLCVPVSSPLSPRHKAPVAFYALLNRMHSAPKIPLATTTRRIYRQQLHMNTDNEKAANPRMQIPFNAHDSTFWFMLYPTVHLDDCRLGHLSLVRPVSLLCRSSFYWIPPHPTSHASSSSLLSFFLNFRGFFFVFSKAVSHFCLHLIIFLLLVPQIHHQDQITPKEM